MSDYFFFIFGLISMMVLTGGTSELGETSSEQLPIYLDDEGKERILKRVGSDKQLEKAYNNAIANKDVWVDAKFDSAINKHAGLKSNQELRNLYSLKDFRVVKIAETNLAVMGGTSQLEFRPIDCQERKKMSTKYRDIHLDSFEINCYSRMPPGSSGYAVMSIYDERYLKPEQGFLATVVFPLGITVSKTNIRINYSVSTLDDMNWMAIITVHEHGLKDNTRPCNFNIKSKYKYTNNLDRFKDNSESDIGTFKLPEELRKDQTLQIVLKNSLDYSLSMLTNKLFLSKLTENELNKLTRMNNISHLPIRIKNESARHSICVSQIDFEKEKAELELEKSPSKSLLFKLSP